MINSEEGCAHRAALVADLCGQPQHVDRTRALLGAVKLCPGDRVLEVGCGSGVVLREIARIRPPGVTVVGIDTDRAVLSEATRSTAGLDGITLLRMDGRALRFDDGEFDLVCCSRLLMHAVNPGLMLSEMARVLRPGGNLLAIEPIASFANGLDEKLHSRVQGQRHPSIARQLPRMLEEVGLALGQFMPHVFINQAPRVTADLREEFRANRGLFAHAIRLRLCTEADVHTYLSAREHVAAARGLFECVVHAGVLATKPEG